MNNSGDAKEPELNKLEWSSTSFKVYDFLSKFTLPQVVKVIEGYYGDDEESSLGADQILTLHCIKSTDKLIGRDYRGKEVNIPVNCQNKVEVRPSNLKDVYENIEELFAAFPPYVRISQGYYSPTKDEEILNVGDKLCLKSIDKRKKGEEKLICVNQNGQTIELPKDCVAGFQPLEDGKEYYLAEIMTRFTMPLYVQFVDPPTMGKQTRTADEAFFNSSLGAIYLESSFNENIIIASAISHDGHRTIVTFPREMDIRLAVCEGLLQNTPAYGEICRTLNDSIDLRKLKRIDTFRAFQPRNSVNEYPYQELVDPSTLSELVDPTTISEESEIQLSQQTEDIQPYKVVKKSEVSDLEPKASSLVQVEKKSETCKKAEVKQASNYVNAAWAQETARNVESLESTSSKNSDGEQKQPQTPPNKPRRKQDSLHKIKNGQSLSKSSDEPESKNINPTISVPTIEVTSPDSENAKKGPGISHYSVKQVTEILKELGMDRYIVKFNSERIDGEMLMCLDNDILMTDFGMNKLHCMKLKKYLEGWRPRV